MPNILDQKLKIHITPAATQFLQNTELHWYHQSQTNYSEQLSSFLSQRTTPEVSMEQNSRKILFRLLHYGGLALEEQFPEIRTATLTYMVKNNCAKNISSILSTALKNAV